MRRFFLAAAAALALVAFAPGDTLAGGKGKSWSGANAWDVPPGFTSPGKRKGWKGRNHPPGWAKGQRKGWNGGSVPPGWR